MSTVKYCADPEPHDMHSWTEEFTYSDGVVTFDYHTCWGIVDTPEVIEAVTVRNSARDYLVAAEIALSAAALKARRSEAEAMGYTDDPDTVR